MRHGLVWRYAKHGRWFARWRVTGRPRLKFVAIPSGQDIWTLRVDLNNKEVSRERCPSSEDVFLRAAKAVRLVQRGMPVGTRPIDTVRVKTAVATA